MKLVYIEEIASKLSRDYPIREEVNIGDVAEWVREALRMIDNYHQWEKKKQTLKIQEYAAYLPDDFYSLDAKQANPKGRVQGRQIYFSIRTGTQTINYLAMPLDERRYPFVPDTEEYKDALTHYCAHKLLKSERLLATQEMNQTSEYDKWLKKKKEARADLHLAQGIDLIHEMADNQNTFNIYNRRPIWSQKRR